MGIERNDRKPKRRRTTAQRMRGRMKPVFQLPAGAPKAGLPRLKADVKTKPAPKAEAKPKSLAKPMATTKTPAKAAAKRPAKKTAK